MSLSLFNWNKIPIKTTQRYEIGDCGILIKKIPNKSIDLILTDIPYNEVNRENNGLRNLDKNVADILTFDLDLFLKESIRVCKGSIYIFCGIEQVSQIKKIFVQNDLSARLCIWEKLNPSPMNGEYIWLSGIECCMYGKFKNATFNVFCKNTVWRYAIVKDQIHPTQKSLKLIQYLINASSNEGDTVLDPCMGSGVVMEACKNLNRNFIGFELNNAWEKYYKDTPKHKKYVHKNKHIHGKTLFDF